MRRWKLWAATLFALVSVLFCLGMVVPIVTTNEYICRECGLHKFIASTTLGGTREYFSEEGRYVWWRRRVDREHGHDWARVWNVKRTLLGTHWRLYPCEGILRSAYLLQTFEKLERLGLDREYFGELTHADPDRREALWDAVEDLEKHREDDAIRAWWEKTLRYLESRSAWATGFREFQ